MSPRIVGQLFILVLFATQVAFGAVRTVSQAGDGEYTSIQAALNAANEGDEIIIKDFATYKEQVTITKNRITLRSDNPNLANKPKILYQDVTNVGPKTCDEAKDTNTVNSKITFDQNGALRVMRAQGVRIEGINIDGGGPAPFAYSGIWNCKDPLFHGNSAVVLWIAGDVTIRNCEMQNAYFGIYVKDRNEGGIFANANPADVAKWRVVPLSGFGKTGNHIFEYNRIHDNSWGLFFESTWDLGSTVRYNLIFENHHSASLSKTVKGLPDGGNQPGGAVLFKDQLLSPVAIYNNTFWHNYTIFAAHWQAGAQHLIFNNIYAEPYMKWAKNPDFQNPFMDMDVDFVNRMKNCLYACQMQDPEKRSQVYNKSVWDEGANKNVEALDTVNAIQRVAIMNGMDNVEKTGQTDTLVLHLSTGDSIIPFNVEWAIQPGALILAQTAGNPFPKDANIRWLEPKFKSTDPTSPFFLVPDWDDPLMKKFIVDQGWTGSDVRDVDGSIADIGAIPYDGKHNDSPVTIKPTEPIDINGKKAIASFSIVGDIVNPKIKYVKWIDGLKYFANSFGPAQKMILTSTNILDANPTLITSPLAAGNNRISFDVATRDTSNKYAFLELVVEGTNSKGDTVTSNVGFVPYRELDYQFVVQIWNSAMTQQLKEVNAGDTVKLKIIARNALDTTKALPNYVIDTAEASLSSSFTLYNTSLKPFTFPRNFNTIPAPVYDVVFTKVPPNHMLENVSVSGKFFQLVSDTTGAAIRGTSDGIKILPGDPDSVKFYDPASNGVKVVNPGTLEKIIAKVYDKYGNLVNKAAAVNLKSDKPTIGDVDGNATPNCDDTGTVVFNVKVTNGAEKDTFPIVATLVSNSKIDNAKCVVGKPQDKFFIFYGDTLAYDASAKITGVSGEKYPVTITATKSQKDGSDIVTTRNTKFAIDFPDNSGTLVAYANKDDTIPITQSQLVSGKTVIWITSLGRTVQNGQIMVYSVDDNSIIKNNRFNINFVEAQFEIQSAAYFADNGDGKVNRVEIFYRDSLKDNTYLPDSIELYWPHKTDDSRRMVYAGPTVTLDPSNKKHITVMLTQPFAEANTENTEGSTQLGTIYWKNPATPQGSLQAVKFNIADSVGPLLKSATLTERLGDGNDTMKITFTEHVDASTIKGKTLTLIKNNSTLSKDLNILEAINLGDTVRIVVENLGADAPKGGDLLKINAAGTIVDRFNNKANPDNRPVTIKLYQVAGDIKSAQYFDQNGDGIVDLLKIQFNKNVIKDSIQVLATWAANNNTVKKALEGADITYSDAADSTVLSVDLNDKFIAVPKDVTSGALDIEEHDKLFPNQPKTITAQDKAAPVIDTVEYHIGVALNEKDKAPDTLKVLFSEPAQSPSFFDQLFNFSHKDSTYFVTFEDKALLSNGNWKWYLVKSVTDSITNSATNPMTGDLVNMKVKVLSDGSNYQNVVDNKKVPLRVFEAPYNLIIKIKKNPFKAKIESVTISFEPTTEPTSFNLAGEAKIYDQLGNLVNDLKAVITKNANRKTVCEFKWDGANKYGRYVGAGTYIVHFNVTDSSKPIPIPDQKIGVKR